MQLHQKLEMLFIAPEERQKGLGNLCSAIISEDKDWNFREFYGREPIRPHKCHQMPFNCCSETAASGTNGSSIELRPIPKEILPQLRFGSTKAKEKPLMLDKDGCPKIISISGHVRKLSEETREVFETLFSV